MRCVDNSVDPKSIEDQRGRYINHWGPVLFEKTALLVRCYREKIQAMIQCGIANVIEEEDRLRAQRAEVRHVDFRFRILFHGDVQPDPPASKSRTERFVFRRDAPLETKFIAVACLYSRFAAASEKFRLPDFVGPRTGIWWGEGSYNLQFRRQVLFDFCYQCDRFIVDTGENLMRTLIDEVTESLTGANSSLIPGTREATRSWIPAPHATTRH